MTQINKLKLLLKRRQSKIKNKNRIQKLIREYNVNSQIITEEFYNITSSCSSQSYIKYAETTTQKYTDLLVLKESLEALNHKIKQSDKEIKQILSNNSQAKAITEALLELPGLGILLVSYLYIYLEGYTKKYNYKKLSNYCRFSPETGRYKVSSTLQYKISRCIKSATIKCKKVLPEFIEYIKKNEIEGKNNNWIEKNLRNKLLIIIGFAISKGIKGKVYINKNKTREISFCS